MEAPFKPCEGSEPFLFVSYAHEDAAMVFEDLKPLHDAGYRIWFDDGIHPGEDWIEALANHINQSALVLFFASVASAASKHCRRELHFSIDSDKPIVVVQLDNEPLPSALKFVLGHQQAILRTELSGDGYRNRLRSSLDEYLPRVPAAATSKRFDSSRLNKVALIPFTHDDQLHDAAERCTEDLNQVLGLSFATVASSVVQRAASQSSDPVELGRSLGAGWIVSAGLRTAGPELRFHAELIDVESGEVAVNSRHRVPLAGSEQFLTFFSEEAAGAIIEAMSARINRESRAVQMEDLDTPALIARSRKLDLFSDVAEIEALLRRAAELEPGNPLPLANLAFRMGLSVSYRISRDIEGDSAKVRQLVEQALDGPGRNNVQALHNCSWACWNVGDHSAALSCARRAYALAPVRRTATNLCNVLIKNGLGDEALELAGFIDAGTPAGFPRPHPMLRDCFCLLENWEAALEHAAQVHDWGPDFHHRVLQAMILAELDRFEEASEQIAIARQTLPKLKLRNSLESQRIASNSIPQLYGGLQKLIDHGIE